MGAPWQRGLHVVPMGPKGHMEVGLIGPTHGAQWAPVAM